MQISGGKLRLVAVRKSLLWPSYTARERDWDHIESTVHTVEVFILVRDREQDQSSIVPAPFPVPVTIPFLCSVTKPLISNFN